MSTANTTIVKGQKAPRGLVGFLFQTMNRLPISLLRSPLHSVMSKQIMLLTFPGRKSKKLYTVPLGYVQDGDNVIAFSAYTNSVWWKNLRGGVPVTVRIEGRDLSGAAEVIEADKKVIAEGVYKLAAKHKGMMGVRSGSDGLPDPVSVAQVAQTKVLIQIRLL